MLVSFVCRECPQLPLKEWYHYIDEKIVEFKAKKDDASLAFIDKIGTIRMYNCDKGAIIQLKDHIITFDPETCVKYWEATEKEAQKRAKEVLKMNMERKLAGLEVKRCDCCREGV